MMKGFQHQGVEHNCVKHNCVKHNNCVEHHCMEPNSMKSTQPLKWGFGILMSLSFSLLGGCATGASSFDCPKTHAAQCQPLHAVDRQVDAGHWGQQPEGKGAQRVSIGEGSEPRGPLRAHDRIQKVWVAPYVDPDDVYHQPATVYAVMQAGHWRQAATQTIRQSELKGGDDGRP
jgi:hypothetical protein